MVKVSQISLQNDYTQPRLFVEQAYQQETLKDRFERLQAAGKFLVLNNKDDFYSKLMGELEDVNKMQADYYKQNHHDGSIMRYSLADFISKRITQEKMSDNMMKEVFGEIKNMR